MVAEFLRYETPTLFVVRIPLEAGHDRRASRSAPCEPILVFLAAANRDPAVFADPDAFRPAGTSPPALSFAYGAHFCLGASLARSEAEVMLATVAAALAGLALAPDARCAGTSAARSAASTQLRVDHGGSPMTRHTRAARIGALLVLLASVPAGYSFGQPAGDAAPRPELLARALTSYRQMERIGLVQNHVLTVIDYALPSHERRLWVIDPRRLRVLFREFVAHGRGSATDEEPDVAASFGNEPASKQSSLGTFLTGDAYVGMHGYSLVLFGLDLGRQRQCRSSAASWSIPPDYVGAGVPRRERRPGGRAGAVPALDPASRRRDHRPDPQRQRRLRRRAPHAAGDPKRRRAARPTPQPPVRPISESGQPLRLVEARLVAHRLVVDVAGELGTTPTRPCARRPATCTSPSRT